MGRKITWIVAVFIILCMSVNADFEASTQNGVIQVCQGSTFSDVIDITTDRRADFTVNTNTNWTTVVPRKLTIHNQAQVFNFIHPPEDPGQYQLVTQISDGKITKNIVQDVTILDCPAYLYITDSSFSNCPCTPTLYTFQISNKNSHAEVFDRFVNAPEFEFEQNPVTVPAGQTVPVYVKVNMPCDSTGDFIFTLSAYARRSMYWSEVPFSLQVRECFDVKVGEAGLEEFRESDERYSLCKGDTVLIPFRIQNNGADDTFSLELYGEGSLDNDELEVAAASSGDSFIEMIAEGSKDFMLIVTDSNGAEQSIDFTVKSRDCKLPYYILIGLVIIIIIAALIYFLSKRKPRRARRARRRRKWSLKWLWLILIIVIIALIIFFWKDIMWFLKLVWGYISLYWLYIMLGVIAAIIIILLHWLLPRFKWKMWHFAVPIILIIVFLLFALFFFTGISSRFGLDVNATNTSENLVYENSTTYIWNKNKIETIDLSKYIVNPDNDQLVFTATPVENMSIIFDGPVAIIEPDKDYFGARIVNFIVDDRRGGRAVSPDIKLIVLDQEFHPVTEFLLTYANFMLVGLVLLVLVVILLVTRTEPKKRVIVKKKRKINK